MQQAPSAPPRHTFWIAAKGAVLDWWDNPPAMLLWLLLTAATVVLLKAAGL